MAPYAERSAECRDEASVGIVVQIPFIKSDEDVGKFLRICSAKTIAKGDPWLQRAKEFNLGDVRSQRQLPLRARVAIGLKTRDIHRLRCFAVPCRVE